MLNKRLMHLREYKPVTFLINASNCRILI